MAEEKKSAIPYLSAVLLMYGYVYLRTYYDSFGIQVHYYFSIEDYIQANIDNVYKTVIPLFLATMFGAFSSKSLQIDNLQKQKIDIESKYNSQEEIPDNIKTNLKNIDLKIGNLYQSKLNDDRINIWTERLGVFGFVSFSILLTFYKKDPQRFIVYLIAIMFVWMWIGHKLIPYPLKEKIAKLDRISIVLLFAVIYVFTALFFYGKNDAAKIIESDAGNNNKIIIKDEYINKSRLNIDNIVMIGKNSKYYFVYDRKEKASHAIPAELIVGSYVNTVYKPNNNDNGGRSNANKQTNKVDNNVTQ